jgi:pyruvate dehydrogenase E2 component (dihydrolipoamide acetyltransferase)
MAEITMPRLSDTMSEGSVSRWLKKPGDPVAVGDIIAEIETDKATMELEAFEAGTLQKILVKEGEVVPIGQPIAIIGEGPVEGDGAPAGGPSPAPQAQPAAPEAAAPAEGGGATAATRQALPASGAAPTDTTRGNGDRVLASPLARRIAEERGIDLRQVQGTGPGGRILKENVEAFTGARPTAAPSLGARPTAAEGTQPAPSPAAPTPAPPRVEGEAQPLSRMRRAIARAMNESKPGVPHIYVTVEIDMGEAMKLRQQINDSGAAPVKVSVNDLVVKAAAKALARMPALNASFTQGADGQPAVVRHPQVNISVAVALEDGLIAPVVRDADKKSIGAIAAEIKDLAGRAREGKIKQNELEGATFQVTNLGMYGVVEFGSIITVPQAASLAVGAVRQIPVVRDGQIVIGEIMNVTLSADHRIVDGAVAAQYLQELTRLLQSPMSLLV